MLGRLAAYVALFVTPLVNTRALSVEEYGYYRQFWLLVDTLVPLLVLGFPRSLLYYLPRCETRREKSALVTQTVLALAVLSIVGIAAYGAMTQWLGQGLGAVARAFFWRLSAFTAFILLTQHFETLFAAERQVVHQAVWGVATTMGQAVTVMLAAWLSRDVSTVIWALVVYGAVRAAVALGFTVRRYRPTLRGVSLAGIREQLSFVLPVGLFGVTVTLLAQTDKFVITRFMGRKAYAVYSVGAFQVPLVNIVAQSIVGVTVPVMSRLQKQGRHAEIADLWRRTVLRTAVIFFPTLVTVELVAAPLIRVLFEPVYAAAAPVLMVYTLLLVRSTVDCVGLIQVYKRNGWLVGAFAVAFVFNLALSIALYRVLGRLGVPLATVIAMTGVNVANIVYASRLTGVGLRRFVPLGGLARRFVVALVPGILVGGGLHGVSMPDALRIVTVGGAYSLVYLWICARTGYLTLGDLRALVGTRS